jgi:hypothetical protein
MCASERETNGTVMTRFYRRFGKVVMDVANGKIAHVRYCQGDHEPDYFKGRSSELIGRAPHEFQAAW